MASKDAGKSKLNSSESKHTTLIAFPEVELDPEDAAFIGASVPPTLDRDPLTYKEAMASPDAPHWIQAMKEEMDALWRNNTMHYARLPPGRRAIDSKFIYKRKRDTSHKVIRWKARNVGKGFLQRKGFDYQDTFAPVARMASARMVLATAVHEDLDIRQVDIDNAYLNGEIDADVYMNPPAGWIWDPKYPKEDGWVLKLDKGLYGIKQAGHIWNECIHSYCLQIGFVRASSDLCVYTREFAPQDGCEPGRLIACLHVDDFLVAGKPKQLEWFKKNLLAKFGIKWTDDLLFLGIKIHRFKDNSLALSQRHYLEAVLKEFNMQDCKPSKTPISKGSVQALTTATPGQYPPLDAEQHSLYRTIVGKLMYAMVATRPDLAYSLSFLGQFAAAPNAMHLSMAIRVLAYVKHTLDHALHYNKPPKDSESGFHPQGYSDSNFAENPTRKSTTGYCYYLNHVLIIWCSKLQSCVATSTSVAEWFALYECIRELISVRRSLEDLGYPQQEPTLVWEDNQTVLGLLKDETHHNKTKHVDIKYFWIKEQILPVGNIADIQYISTDDNLADFFTKQQPLAVFEKCCKDLGLTPLVL